MTHTACPFQACCLTCLPQWGCFLQLELRCTHLPLRKGWIFEPALWVGVQSPCDFLELNGCALKRFNIAESLTKVVFNKTTHYRQQPRLPFPFAIKPIDQGPMESIFNKRHMVLTDFSSLFIELLAFQRLQTAAQTLILRTETSKAKPEFFPSLTSDFAYSFHALSQMFGILHPR